MEASAKNSSEKQREIDFQWFLISFLIHWKWFVLSVALFLFIGYAHLKNQVNVYSIASTIILKGSGSSSSNDELGIFEAMGVVKANNNLENEIRIMKSRNMIEKVIVENQLFVQYSVIGRFNKSVELYGYGNPYYGTTPVKVYVDSTVFTALGTGIYMTISVTPDSTILAQGTYGSRSFSSEFTTLPGAVETPVGDILLLPDANTTLTAAYPLEVSILPPNWVTGSYIPRLNVGKNGNTIILSMYETNIQRASDFLTKLVQIYNDDAIDDKNNASKIALSWVNSQLKDLEASFIASEDEIQAFKEAHEIALLDGQISYNIPKYSDYNEAALGWESQYAMFDLFKKEVEADGYTRINTAITFDQNLQVLSQRYNSAVDERDRVRKYASDDLPLIKIIDTKVQSLKEQLTDELNVAKFRLDHRHEDAEKVRGFFTDKIKSAPSLQRKMSDLDREFGLVQGMYSSFLQTKSDLELSMAVNVPVVKVLESPMASGPVSPNRQQTYLICLLCGILAPYLILGLRSLLNFKISDEEEVMRHSEVPAIITLPLVKKTDQIQISATSTSPVAERFRLLRTNLLSVLGKNGKSVLITSTLSGEGKTFVSINLAMTFSLKFKTLLVGLDIRRPNLSAFFSLPKKMGVISYLTGEETNVDKLIYKNINSTSLDVLTSGVVPPNPNELLMDSSVEELFAKLREKYEYIIIDSSPVGIVSDAFQLKRVADVSLFVVRSGLTPKSAMSLANNIHREDRLNNLNLVLNAFHRGSGRYGYGYGYYRGYNYSYYGGYGYTGSGYGYSYGYDYTTKDEK
jgi:capsular exopolysaccharide synthesis family protein